MVHFDAVEGFGMKTIVLHPIGRFGNQCMQYLFARAVAEMRGVELQVGPWIGEEVFDIPINRPTKEGIRPMTEAEVRWWMEVDRMDVIEFRGYAQCQTAMIYTRRQAREWLKIKSKWLPSLDACIRQRDVIAHRRVGDYAALGYPVVSEWSYEHACWWNGLDVSRMKILTEETASKEIVFPEHLSFMRDFYKMMKAAVLLRGNSSFSWMAALLGEGAVFSPVIPADAAGGKEHNVNFVPGNHPRFCHLEFVTDLYVNEI
jgi:hypothetical protein